MNASITTMKDPEGNVLYPKTKTDAIYDGSSNRLDQTLTSIQGDLGSKSSASAVAGNDAFSKISTLNSGLASLTDYVEIGAGASVSVSGCYQGTVIIGGRSGMASYFGFVDVANNVVPLITASNMTVTYNSSTNKVTITNSTGAFISARVIRRFV